METDNKDVDNSESDQSKDAPAKKDKNLNWVAILALVVSIGMGIYTVCNDIGQNNRIEKTEFKTRASENRPLLSVVKRPNVVRVEYKADIVVPNQKIVMNNVKVNAKLKIDTIIKLRNEGNSIAKLIFYSAANYPSGTAIMRDIVSDKDGKSWSS